MISKDEVNSILRKYESRKITLGTLGSHSALNIFKGAKEEGFSTVCVCKKGDEIVYKRFPLADQVILVEDFSELLDDEVQQKLREANTILVPHGSFNAYVGTEKIIDKLRVPLFGNRELLNWETDREKQREWLKEAGLKLPKTFENPDDIDGLVIAKFAGAMGGKGYFLVESPESFHKKAKDMIKRGHLKEKDLENIHFQEYVIGVNVYPLYFHSPLNKEVELLGMPVKGWDQRMPCPIRKSDYSDPNLIVGSQNPPVFHRRKRDSHSGSASRNSLDKIASRYVFFRHFCHPLIGIFMV